MQPGATEMLKNPVRHERGQSIVELALVLPMLILLLLAVMEGGRIFSAYVELQSVAKDGARFASIACTSETVLESQIPAWTEASLTPWVLGKVASLDLNALQVDFARKGAPGTGTGTWVEVSLTYSLEIVTPIIRNITGNPFVLQSRMAMRSE